MLSLGINVERLRRHLSAMCGKQLTRKDLHNIRTLSKRSAVNEDNILEEWETILVQVPVLQANVCHEEVDSKILRCDRNLYNVNYRVFLHGYNNVFVIDYEIIVCVHKAINSNYDSTNDVEIY